MCPSFSLCAWRILKMRSCLRRPLAPGRSSWRAILVSSVMFFSLNSEIVIVTYGDLLLRRDVMAGGARRRGALRQRAAGLRLRSPVPKSIRRVRLLQCDSALRSSCPECACWDDETSASLSTPVGKACNDCAAYELLQKPIRTA